MGVPISGKKVIKLLKKRGWAVESQRGSHVKLTKGKVTVIVPAHGSKDLGLGLVRKIEKQSGEKIL